MHPAAFLKKQQQQQILINSQLERHSFPAVLLLQIYPLHLPTEVKENSYGNLM